METAASMALSHGAEDACLADCPVVDDSQSLETALEERERELIEAQRIAKLGSWSWVPSTGAVTWSRELYSIFERKTDLPPLAFEEHGKVFTAESSARLAAAMEKTLDMGEPFELDLEVALPSGIRKWITGRGEAELSADGKVVTVRGTIQEITERKRSEEHLALSEARYRALVRASADIVTAGKLDGTEMEDTSEWRAFTGLSAEQTANGGWSDAIHPEDKAISIARWKESISTGTVFELEQRIRRHDGEYRNMLARAVPIRNATGEVVEWISTHSDITDRKRAEETIRATQSRYRKLFESDMLGICVPDRFGAFYEGNEEFLRIVGYTREDLEAGKVRWDVMTPPEYAATDAAHIAEAAQRGSCTPYEKEYIRKDGSRVPINCGYALLEGSQDQYVGFIQDLSAQKQAEAALREREQRFRVLAESLPQFVWIRDGAGNYIYCNQRLLDYVGKPVEWLHTQAFDAVHPDDREMTRKKWQHTFETGEPYENEYRLLRHDGVYRFFLARAVPIRDEAGQIERWLGSTTDIHDQKLAEEALRRSEKLATAGRLAASMAHEINNPLNSVINTVYLALQDTALSGHTRKLLEAADQELTRVAQFTTQTLRFHKQSHSPAPADLCEIMDSVFAMYTPRFRNSSIQLEQEYLTHTRLRCFNSELRQVFANLVGNALDAMAPGGRLTIRIRLARALDGSGESGIRVVIADTGHGIPADLQKRVFEPFMSTKETTGVGLGLWVSEGIVKKHGGRIALRSSTNAQRHGTVFSLFFPIRTPQESIDPA